MTPERDDVLAEIGEALKIEPRGDFHARVRASVEADQAGHRPFWRWATMTGVAGVGVAILLVSVWPSPRGLNDRPAASEAASGTEPTRSIGNMPTRSETEPAFVRRTASATSVEARYEVVVAPGQAQLWQSLSQQLREGRVQLPPQASAVVEPLAMRTLEDLPPVEIPLVRIDPLEPSEIPVDPAVEAIGS